MKDVTIIILGLSIIMNACTLIVQGRKIDKLERQIKDLQNERVEKK